jgi:branched-chain amino acid transport system permease protein
MIGHRVTTLVSRHPVPIAVVALGLAPFVLDYTPLYTALFTEVLVFGLYGLAFDLLLGHTGVLSFGHCAFFGVGSYATGLLLAHLKVPVEVAVLAGATAGCLTAWGIGLLALRKRGVYFAMLTLAMSQVFYYAVLMWPAATGGSDGLTGIPKLVLGGPIEVRLSGRAFNTYWFIAVVVAASGYVLYRIHRSPFGRVMHAVRANEQRAAACGYDTRRVRLVALTTSGLFAGLAGALLTIVIEFVPIENVHWFMSGTVVILTLFGGSGTFFGPFVGAAVFLWMKDWLSKTLAYWEIFVGASFVLIVLLLPDGIVGTIRKLRHARATRDTAATGEAPERVSHAVREASPPRP